MIKIKIKVNFYLSFFNRLYSFMLVRLRWCQIAKKRMMATGVSM